ncbi:FadR/GntR family transcriptional regulator [Shewanella dokdonensis]|uniref:FadR/GntR family transcriptional regulator n=1 Tax=Shewanella dokdonensis TaxID=712036 RepID=UPI001FCF9D0D|nr:GntR family transcriptional regulator [Shewanella dokdonensis]MCL1075276.1 GntR family transcriptional regulator [Shewanella dokdonensis]
MRDFKPVGHIKASTNIYAQLRTAILDGRYAAGQKLPSESELISYFNVSRTTIREAIKGLEASGLVDIKRGAMGGAFVKPIGFERVESACNDLFFSGKFSFYELQYALLLIGQMIARQAAHNCTSEDAKILQQFAFENKKSCQFLAEKIANLTHNRFLIGLFQSLVQVTSGVKKQHQSNAISAHLDYQGSNLVNAIIQRDESMAEMEMSQILRSYFDELTLFNNEI